MAVALFVLLLVGYVGATRGRFTSTDEIGVFQATRSLWEEGSAAITSPEGAPGRGGRNYTVVNSGQSVAALPLYGLGKAVRVALQRAGAHSWVRTFAGPAIERPGGDRWGGEVEIFFVNLFNCVQTALLVTLFFAFSLRLGVSGRVAVAVSVLLAFCSYIGGFASGFFQHPSEALFLLASFYWLFADARAPGWRARLLGGASVALLLQFRYPAIVAVPGLLAYHLAVVWRRRPAGHSRSSSLAWAGRQAFPFLGALAAGFVLHAADQYAKFGTVFLTGQYGRARFDSNPLVGLYGFLLSPGFSIFLYAPLLLLAPWTLARFVRKRPLETFFILFQTSFYLVCYSMNENWHGLWYFGPRYLAALIPLLMLPLGPWLEEVGRRGWAVVAPLATAGLFVQALHVIVDFWQVALYEHYLDFTAAQDFLFVGGSSPLLAHARALFAWDRRDDPWLLTVWRTVGAGRALAVGIPLLAAGWLSARLLLRRVQETGAPPRGLDPLFRRSSRRLSALGAAAAIVTAVGLAVGLRRAPTPGPAPPAGQSRDVTDGELMRRGRDALYARGDLAAAETCFRAVLARTPAHLGATMQLALVLDASGRAAEARPLWEQAVRGAEAAHDAAAAQTARRRLEENP
jgi:hypothetical protein